jgi:LysR family transcriptional activator of nhaA
VTSLNFKHLHYFWSAAQEGSITRAAERLGVAVQTVSGQIAVLERSLGRALFVAQGRGLALTEAGRTALAYADRIFQLGDQLVDDLAQPDQGDRQRLVVGISDGLPKLVAHRLLAEIQAAPARLRLVCHEGEFEDLLADLAVHRLDVVLTDRPATGGGNLRLISRPLGELAVGFYAVPSLAERLRPDFPRSLAGAPVLLPTRHNRLRDQIDRWLEETGIRPDIIGEFEDSALLQTFGRSGLGLFPAPLELAEAVERELGAFPVGPLGGVCEQIFAIANARRIAHPAVEALCAVRLGSAPSLAL